MIKGFHHAVLFCKDTGASRAWHMSAGFEYKRGYDGMHWFALGDGEIMLHPGAGSGSSTTIHVGAADLDSLFARVVDAGLNPFDHQQPGVNLQGPVVRPWGIREFELKDPDGRYWAFTEVD